MKFNYEQSVTRSDLLQLLRERWNPTPETELVPVQEALGRVTAQDLFSRNTLPVVRSSCFDGVAVRSSDFANGLPDTTKWVKGQDFVRADTGDDFPDAFDTIIAIEDIVLEGDSLRFAEGFEFDPADKNVNPAGTLVRKDALLVPAHTRLTPELLAALAMGGVDQVPVYRKMRVAFLPTGSELVPVGVTPVRGQNVETNGLMLRTLLAKWGAEVICLDIRPDDPDALETMMDEGLQRGDLVIINGGSSRGEEDFNSEILQRRGSFFRHGVRTVPGRPIAASIIDGKPVLNVPGPAAACYLAAHWCLSALIAHYYGVPAPQCPQVQAVLTERLGKRPNFERVVRLRLRWQEGRYLATPIDRGEGGLPELMLRTDAMFTIPQAVSGYEAGDHISVELLKSPELIEGAPALL